MRASLRLFFSLLSFGAVESFLEFSCVFRKKIVKSSKSGKVSVENCSLSATPTEGPGQVMFA